VLKMPQMRSHRRESSGVITAVGEPLVAWDLPLLRTAAAHKRPTRCDLSSDSRVVGTPLCKDLPGESTMLITVLGNRVSEILDLATRNTSDHNALDEALLYATVPLYDRLPIRFPPSPLIGLMP